MRYAKRSIILIGLLVLPVAACGDMVISNPDIIQGSGNIVTESREVSGFQAIEMDNPGRLIITQGDAEALTVEADDNILPLLTSVVADGKLTLDSKPDSSYTSKGEIIFRVTVKDLNTLTLTSAGNTELDRLNTTTLAIGVMSAGNLRLGTLIVKNDLSITVASAGAVSAERVECQNLNLTGNGSGSADIKAVSAVKIVAKITSAGSVTLAGTADEQDIQVSGSGHYNAQDLDSAIVRAAAGSSGDIRVKVSEHLDATVTGSGSIFYSGTAQVTSRDDGAGSITPQ
ncbi:MAG: DUF2807 domain-containing protein [Chloroflexi bacterium]|nr:DUF2807 domain-containing protein [Chloroflexota bacterium]